MAFLEAGDKPIYIGFGSMAEQRGAAIASALDTLVGMERRLILGGDLARYAERLDPRYAFPAREVDHQLLFPRLAAVAHHGGAGTTYTAARTGIPQVIVPHIMDQFYWAERVERLGIGRKCRGYSTLTAKAFVEKIVEAASDAAIRKRARDLSRFVENEAAHEEATSFIVEAVGGGRAAGGAR